VAAAAVSDNTQLKRRVEKELTAKAVQRQAQPFDDRPFNLDAIHDCISLDVTFTGSDYASNSTI